MERRSHALGALGRIGGHEPVHESRTRVRGKPRPDTRPAGPFSVVQRFTDVLGKARLGSRRVRRRRPRREYELVVLPR